MAPLSVTGLLLLVSISCVFACEPIQVETCRGLGYNVTGMPNLVGNELQRDAEFTLNTFQPLIQYGCSAQLKFFLCSVFVPMCTEKINVPIGPCRGLCESVRAKCFPVLHGFGFLWPASLNCSKFPLVNNHEHMCMEGPQDSPSAGETMLSPPVLSPITVQPPSQEHCSRYVHSHVYVYLNRSGCCAPRCDADVLFGPADKKLAEAWLSLWAAMCFVSSLLAVLTFLVDSGGGQARFRYPERPLAFLALCYNLASVGWGVLALAGRNAVACSPDPHAPGRLLLSQDGLANANCAVVFLLLYYFGIAASVWWVVLSAAWFLAAALRWTHDRIQQHSSLFHLAGWGLPAALTIAVLVLRDVDADELTGACFVGNQSTRSLLVFVLIPQALFLVLGVSLLLLGFMALFRSSSAACSSRRDDSGSGSGLVRLGAFGALFAVPAACVVASLVYEYWERDTWLLRAQTPAQQPRPCLWVFLLRLFMTLVVGVTATLWVWSPKTLRAWRRLFRRLGPYKPAPVKCYPIHCYSHPPHQHPQQHKHQPLQRTHKHRKYRQPHGSETTV
ncbi:frizzled-4 [Anabrus simplex]|uniref:frizzled-4 n=1 Tax=Anabrus simplex TaxID=316456 RepID=UPI0035A26830